MRLIDIYFKAFSEYRKNTIESNEAVKIRRIIKRTNHKEDKLIVTKYNVVIEEEWIKNIEEGLIFIEKAIFEDRQFIRTEGDVVNIEKVKKTSKDSVEHLSRNSNLITRVPKEGDILIPDKLYIVEKLSDYAVYENKFLYLLLVYLRDFIYTRLETIKNKVTSYHSEVNLNKDIKLNNRNLNYNLNFIDSYDNDPFLMNDYYKIPFVERIESIFYHTEGLLKSQLMVEVSKVAMIKPPIVKTNVLRMNPNFRAALSLYDYITSYNELGYEFKTNQKSFNPFLDGLNDEIADAIELQTFIFYQNGNDIVEDLKAEFQRQELLAQNQKEELRKQELRRLKKRVKELGVDLEEYILLLEADNKKLVKDNSQIDDLKQLNVDLNLNIKKMSKTIENLNFENNELEKNLALTIENHKTEVFNLNEAHRLNISEIENEHTNYINSLKIEHNNEINNLNSTYKEQIDLIKSNNQEIVNELNSKIKDVELNMKEVIDKSSELDRLSNLKVLEANKKSDELESKLYAYMKSNNSKSIEDFHSSKEKFEHLEKLKKSFNSYFDKQWKLAKKAIVEEEKLKSKQIQEENIKNK